MSALTLKNDDPDIHCVLGGHQKTITSISFHPDDSQFATSSKDSNIMIWTKWSNRLDAKPSYCFSGHQDVVTSVDYSPNGTVLASSSKDQTVRLWTPSILGKSKEFKAHTCSVNTVKFSSDGLRIVTGSNDKSLKLWDVTTCQFIASYRGHNNWVRSAKFSAQGNLIMSCSDDRTVRVWDCSSGEIVHTFVNHMNSPNYVAAHPSNNNVVAVAMNSGDIRLYDVRTKALQQQYSLHDNATCLDWHPRQNYLLTTGSDGNLCIVDVMEGRPLYTFKDGGGGVACKFSMDGKFFASGGAKRIVTVWKTNFID